MTLSKQLFFCLFVLFPLLHASHPEHCSRSLCGPDDVHVRFPFWLLSKQPEFCGYAGFNLHCTSSPKTALKLPNSGTFLVRKIDYLRQQIRLYDPENCLARKLLTFDISGSPFSAIYLASYTFLSCPNEVVKSSGFESISCLGNSTNSFLATTSLDLVKSVPSSCQIVKTVAIPVSRPVAIERSRFSTDVNDPDLWLKWDSPSCSDCEISYLRCGFINNASLEVKCFPYEKSGPLSNVFVSVSISVAVTLFAICIVIRISKYRFDSRTQRVSDTTTTQQPSGVMSNIGLDQSTIETYKKLELGESRRLPGTTTGLVCPICLSEYASKETLRSIPECDHWFHMECIDVWLKIHGSCPLCRNSRTLRDIKYFKVVMNAANVFSDKHMNVFYVFCLLKHEIICPEPFEGERLTEAQFLNSSI